jgi:hypothetical protein
MYHILKCNDIEGGYTKIDVGCTLSFCISFMDNDIISDWDFSPFFFSRSDWIPN